MKSVDYLITFDGSDFVIRLAPLGPELNRGSCARALARWAWAQDADSVVHDYDLKLDACPEHTLRRIRE